MSVHHQPDSLLRKHLFHPRSPSIGIASDMRQQDLDTLHGEYLQFSAFTSDHPVVDISADGPDHRHNLLQSLHNGVIADIPGMPHFIAIAEVLPKPVVPFSMGVAQYSYSFHFFCNYRLDPTTRSARLKRSTQRSMSLDLIFFS